MASRLYRLGRFAFRRWPIFLVVWLVVLTGLGFVAGRYSKPMTQQFTMPGIESMEAAHLQSKLFPDAAPVEAANVSIVVATRDGSRVDEGAAAKATTALVQRLSKLTTIDGAIYDPVRAAGDVRVAAAAKVDAAEKVAKAEGRPFDRAATLAAAKSSLEPISPISEDGSVATIDFRFKVDAVADVTPEMQQQVLHAMDATRAAGLKVEAGGTGMQAYESPDGSSEMIGIVLALIILALAFGSVVAAGLPILTAGIGVGIGISGITAMTAFAEIPSTTTILASMIGLAVGIDYALFILHRYRSELDAGAERAEAIGLAVGTAGSAVVFAGLTVVIALVALWVVGIPFLTAMGLGAAVTVTVAVLIALTLLPALLGMFGSKAFALRFRRYRPRTGPDGRTLNNGARWARFIGHKPLAWVLGVVVVLGVVAIPIMDMHLAFPSDSTAPTDTSRRKAADMVSDAFGPGRLAPMLVIVDARGVHDATARTAAFEKVAAWVGEQNDVAHVTVLDSNDKGASILIQPAKGPEDEATGRLLDALRSGEDRIAAETGTTLGITGMTAIETDISAKLAGALAPYLGIVIGLAFLLLMVVFRSILVPLTATLGFLLSVLATLGATVAIFQKGWFGLFPEQPIISFMPVFLIGIVFGLAMDYQVFLVTRVREARVHWAGYREAIVDGFRNSARVVTAAALIMTSVFAGFIFMDEPIIQSIGFALAVAVLFDAFVVRMLLIPSLLYLMGDKAWWLPKWLDRVLPNVDIEGEHLERSHHGGVDVSVGESTDDGDGPTTGEVPVMAPSGT